jgi:tetratricopeptide (TPR) repeat protein
MQNLQTTDHFIGRDDELNFFKKWLVASQGPHVLYFHDALKEQDKKGGIGKTWLLNKCREIARQLYPKTEMAIASIDFFNVGDRNGVVVAERIVEALRTTFPDWIPTSFLETMEEYRNTQKPDVIDETTEVRSALFKALTTDLHYLERQLAKEQKGLLVFYDTYELVEQNPIVAALRFSQKFPDTYQFEHMYTVIAGRNELNWMHPNWKGREQEVQMVALAPFSQAEMVEYIDVEAYYDIDAHSEQTKALYVRTEGRPILIGLATDVLNKHIMTLENLAAIPLDDFEPRLVMQINNLEHPLNWTILFMAHAYHRFNLEILNWILRESNLKRLIPDIQYAELAKSLPTVSFVRKAGFGEDFVLHDEMRRLVNKYCWPMHDKDFRYRNAISRSVIEYYEDVMTKELDQQKRQTYRIEVLFHKLFLNLEDGFQYFRDHFYSAIRLWQSPFARTLLQEAQQFEHNMSADQRYHLQMALARLLRAEENPGEALIVYETLERQADEQWTSTYRLDLLNGKAVCYLDLNRFLEAIDSFTQSLEIARARNDEPEMASHFGWLGLTYRRRGQFDTAIQYYEECLALRKHLNDQREYASTLNNISHVYRLQGKMDEALLRCKIALRLRKDLLKEGKIGEFAVGLTLNTIGQIYLAFGDIIQAEQAFQQSYEIFRRANYKKSISGTLNRFGQIEIAKGNLQSAKHWYEQAQAAAAGINIGGYINSINGQGRILALQHRWAEAVVLFQEALDLARQAHDDLQRAENLLGLAEALLYMKEQQQARSCLQEAEQLSLRWNYFHLLGIAAEFQGDVAYKDGHYQEAFTYYREYCYNMARRNTQEYGKALRKLTDLLVIIPKDQIHPIADALITYWSEQHMDTNYPDFVAAFKDVDDSF